VPFTESVSATLSAFAAALATQPQLPRPVPPHAGDACVLLQPQQLLALRERRRRRGSTAAGGAVQGTPAAAVVRRAPADKAAAAAAAAAAADAQGATSGASLALVPVGAGGAPAAAASSSDSSSGSLASATMRGQLSAAADTHFALLSLAAAGCYELGRTLGVTCGSSSSSGGGASDGANNAAAYGDGGGGGTRALSLVNEGLTAVKHGGGGGGARGSPLNAVVAQLLRVAGHSSNPLDYSTAWQLLQVRTCRDERVRAGWVLVELALLSPRPPGA
jgi:hypothetical protein